MGSSDVNAFLQIFQKNIHPPFPRNSAGKSL